VCVCVCTPKLTFVVVHSIPLLRNLNEEKISKMCDVVEVVSANYHYSTAHINNFDYTEKL